MLDNITYASQQLETTTVVRMSIEDSLVKHLNHPVNKRTMTTGPVRFTLMRGTITNELFEFYTDIVDDLVTDLEDNDFIVTHTLTRVPGRSGSPEERIELVLTVSWRPQPVPTDSTPPVILMNTSYLGSSVFNIDNETSDTGFSSEDFTEFSLEVEWLDMTSFDKVDLLDGLIQIIVDNVDEVITPTAGMIVITPSGGEGGPIDSITGPGYYIVQITAEDSSENTATVTINLVFTESV